MTPRWLAYVAAATAVLLYGGNWWLVAWLLAANVVIWCWRTRR